MTNAPTDPFWDQALRLTRHVFIRRRAEFQLAHVTPPNWEAIALEAGRFGYSIGDRRGEAEGPGLVLYPPGVRMRREVLEPVTFHFFIFDLPDRAADAQLLAGDPFGTFTLRDTQRLRSDFAYLRFLFQQPINPQLAWETHFLRDMFYMIGIEQRLSQQPSRPHDQLMEQARVYLQEHADAPINLRRLAGELNLSPVQLTRRFHGAYGQTPSDFVTALRLQQAQSLLVATDLTLDVIAEQCGYASRYYLSRIFTSKVGITPTAFRKRQIV